LYEELHEQPTAASRALNYGGRLLGDNTKLKGLDTLEAQLVKYRHIVFNAMGSSRHAALFGEYLFRKLRLFDTVQTLDPTEFDPAHYISPSSLMVSISQSGETKEVIEVTENVKERELHIISLTNTVGSRLSTLADSGVYLNAGMEYAKSSTKCFLNTCIVLAEIAVWFSYRLHHTEQKQLRETINEELTKFPMLIGGVINQCER
jgi:glucosamine--fructose-6-phosphate aminotransferase (isomerizing)